MVVWIAVVVMAACMGVPAVTGGMRVIMFVVMCHWFVSAIIKFLFSDNTDFCRNSNAFRAYGPARIYMERECLSGR